MENCRVLIVDDHRVVIEGIRSLFAAHAEFEVVGKAASGKQALECMEETQPDIVVLDISMPGMSGLETAKAILARAPATKIIVYTMFSEQSLALELYKCGVAGLVLKEDDPKELIRAAHAVREGRTAFGKLDPRHLLHELLHTTADSSEQERIENLSPRELEIFRMLADGVSVKHIAETLHISPKTVETHKYNILEKLQVTSLTGLTKLALRHGLITVLHTPEGE